MAPEPGPIGDRVDHAGLALGNVVKKLRPIAPQGRKLGFLLSRDVEDEAGPLDNAQMNAEIVEDPRWMEWVAGNIRLGELAPESGIFHQLGRREVVWVRVFPERSKQQAGTNAAENGGESAAVLKIGLE